MRHGKAGDPISVRSRRFGVAVPLLILAVGHAASGQDTAKQGEVNNRDTAPERVTVEEVSFRHGKDSLSGSLYLPRGKGPHPAVVMVLGSGSQDRNYGGAGSALAGHFARAGFACLAYDKPGCGKSSGDFQGQTFRDRADEALAAIRFLRDRKDIVPDRIGLWGHSQGGMVAPLAASLSGDVAFVIEVSGWQGPVWKQDAIRVGEELREAGFAEPDVGQAVAFAEKRMELIRGTGPYEVLGKEQDAVKDRPWFRSVHHCDRALFESARRNVGLDTTPWWPGVRCPVLVIYADRDASGGPPEPLIAIIRRGLEAAGNQDVTVRIFRDADHSICRVPGVGGPKAEARAKPATEKSGPDFAPGYVESMTAWLRARFGPSRR